MKRTKTFLLTMLMLFATQCVVAQISITINPPNVLQSRPSDVFNATFSNATGVTQRAYFIATIINTVNGVKYVSARTNVQEYGVGMKRLDITSLAPSYAYGNQSVELTGYLPYGNYQYCLRAIAETTNEEIGSGCIDVEITPMSPPLLLSPDNGAEVSVPNPLLVWLPPTPVNPRMGVLYDLKLVEVLPNQSPYDAVQRNYALIEPKGMKHTNLPYPANATKLEEGKTYAWKVAAKSGDGNVIGETEIWTFTYKKIRDQKTPEPMLPEAFSIPKEKIDGDFVACGKILKVAYTDSLEKSKIELLDLTYKNLGEISAKRINSVGEHRYDVDLTGSKVKEDNYYIIRITGTTGQTSFLTIRYKK